jgi:hypothetical protein
MTGSIRLTCLHLKNDSNRYERCQVGSSLPSGFSTIFQIKVWSIFSRINRKIHPQRGEVVLAPDSIKIIEVVYFQPCVAPLTIQNPKSGRAEETIYAPRKLLLRLNDFVRANGFKSIERNFPISYVAAWWMVKKADLLVDIELRTHDLRRHAATYASRFLPLFRL